MPQTPAKSLPTLRVGEGWGVNLGFYDLTDADIQRLNDSGLKWVRRDLTWSEVEKKKGVYDFSAWDRLLAALEKTVGVRPIFILSYGNDLYQEGSPRTPEARAAFVRFVEAALAHFRGRGIVWEIWNEPNGPEYWHPAPNPDEYAALANDVADAFAKGAPGETVVAPALAGIDLPYLEAVAKTGLFKKIDGLTVHPYRPMEPESVLADVARLRILAARYGRPDLPILSGEWGYSAASNGLGEEKQGDYAARQHLALLAAGVPLTVWYNWRNNGPDAAKEIDNYGLLRPDNGPKPAFESVKSLATMLGGFRYRTRLAAEKPEDWVLLFERDGRPGLAAWTLGAPHEAEVYPGVKMNLTSRPQALLPERRSGWLDAAVALPSIPPFVAYDGPDEAARLLRSVQASLPPGGAMDVRMLLPVVGPVKLTLRAGELGSEETLTKYVSRLPRSPDPVRLRLSIGLDGGDLRQETLLQSLRPIEVEVRPKPDGTGLLAVRASGGFDGSLKILRGEATEEHPLKLEDGAEATFPLPSLEMPAIAVLSEGGRVVRITDSARFVPVPLAGVTTSLEGGEGVYGKAGVVDPAPEAEYPGAKGIDFNLGKGWKYVLGALPRPRFIPGRPVSYGLWVNGDASGALLLMRMEDATGQTFQPAGVPIDWKGWRYVRFSLRGDTGGRWGGANDGVVHLPAKITAPFVIDNPGGKGVQGSIQVAGAMVGSQTE